MKRRFRLFIEDIIESIKLIEEYMGNTSKKNLGSNQKLKDSIVRRLEIIGEAVKNIPDSFRKKYPKIAWKDIAGFRDILSHAYFGVNLETVWKTVHEDIPYLKKEISAIKKDFS